MDFSSKIPTVKGSYEHRGGNNGRREECEFELEDVNISQELNKSKELKTVKVANATTDFETYVSSYVRYINYINVYSALGLHHLIARNTVQIEVTEINANSHIDLLKQLSVGLEGLGEGINAVDLGFSGARLAIVRTKLEAFKEELVHLKDKYVGEKIPEDILLLEKELIGLQKEFELDKEKFTAEAIFSLIRIAGLIANNSPLFEGLTEVLLIFKILFNVINLTRASINFKDSYKNAVDLWSLHSQFKSEYVSKVKIDDSEKSQTTSELAEKELSVLNQFYELSGKDANSYEKESLDIYHQHNIKKIDNSVKLKEQSDLIVKTVNSKYSLEKNFLIFDLIKNGAILAFATISLGIGIGVTVAFFTGTLALTPASLVFLTLSLIGVFISIKFAIAHYIHQYRYKPHYFKATLVDGYSSKLLRNQFYYYIKEWYHGAATVRNSIEQLEKEKREKGELNSEKSLKLTNFKQVIEELNNNKKDWIDSVQEKIEEANWRDLIRYMNRYEYSDNNSELDADSDTIKEFENLLKSKTFSYSVMDKDLLGLIKFGGTWNFLTNSNFNEELRKHSPVTG